MGKILFEFFPHTVYLESWFHCEISWYWIFSLSVLFFSKIELLKRQETSTLPLYENLSKTYSQVQKS